MIGGYAFFLRFCTLKAFKLFLLTDEPEPSVIGDSQWMSRSYVGCRLVSIVTDASVNFVRIREPTSVDEN